MTPYVACRQCPICLNNRTSCYEKISVIGVHQDDGFSEYLCVSVSNLLVVGDTDPGAVALIGPFAISARAVRRAAIRAGGQVLVIDAGLTGLGTAVVARADGTQIVATDTSPARYGHIIQHLGLATFGPSDPPFIRRLSATFGGSLTQKVIDATGNQQAMNNTVNLICHGGSIILVGLFKGELQFPDPEFHKKETTVMGSRNAMRGDFVKVGRLMARGKIATRMMLTHRYDLRSLADIYESDVINNR